MDALRGALAPMVARDQFVTWYAVPCTEPHKLGKYEKIPCDWRTGYNCNPHDPTNWTTYDVAAGMAPQWDQGHGAGAGFVFTAADPFFFLDIDGALQADGQWSPMAHELCARFPGAAVEVSHSGRGLHVFGSYTVAPVHGTRNTPLHLELYTNGRFVALTGRGIQGRAGVDCTQALAATVAQYFPPAAAQVAPQAWTTMPVPEWSGPDDDGELIRRAHAAASRSAASVFGGKASFADLWAGNVPHDGHSEADQSLANHLAFWTGKDCERMERLMRMSGLLREKWDSPSHAGYLTTTILKACAFVTNVATEPSRPQPAASGGAVPEGQRDASREYMAPYEQPAHFAGCVFVEELERIYSAPLNRLMKREAFDVRFGGHLFVLDPMGQKTTDSAYLALTRSRVNIPPIVDDICFRPALAAGAIVSDAAGRRIVNTYAPYHCVSIPGDVSRWLNHLAVMLPVGNDCELLLQYLARIVQQPGVKVPWWPVVQGTRGNGKTLLIEAMEYIFGEAYSHRPNAAALARDGMKFNAWLRRKTFIALEEVALTHRREFMEEFKVIVTGERVSMEPKGVDATTGDNAANGLICTNHRDGVPIDDDERRYGIFYCAQQHKADLVRDGFTESYFADFRGWLKGIDGHAGDVPGFAHIAHYLQTYVLPAVLPSRAPETSSTRAAIRASLGQIEQRILDAIESEQPGFAGGWVSSKYLDDLIARQRVSLPLNKRREVMQSLGYDWHPALHEGRVSDAVTPDNARSKLYVRYGHLALNITDPAQVAAAYSKAQSTSVAARAFGAQ